MLFFKALGEFYNVLRTSFIKVYTCSKMTTRVGLFLSNNF